MILTPTKLKEIGEALHGKRWGEPTAHDMGITPQMVVRYRHGEASPRRSTRERLAAVCQERAKLLMQFADELLS